MNLKINKSEHRVILKNYRSGLRATALAQRYNVNRSTIENILKKYDQKSLYKHPRKYNLNENYFNEINSEEKAYFLGLLYADGYNNEDKGAVALQLQEGDVKIIKELVNALNYEGDIGFIRKRKPHHSNKARLSISSITLSKSLAKKGCVQCKSLILKFPTQKIVPNHLLKHFIRGYFDGDGSVSFSKPKKITVTITSSDFFCKILKNKIFNSLKIKSSIQNYKYSKAKTLRISGNRICLLFLDWIYDGCFFRLDRKFEKFKEIINSYNLENLKFTGGSKINIHDIILKYKNLI